MRSRGFVAVGPAERLALKIDLGKYALRSDRGGDSLLLNASEVADAYIFFHIPVIGPHRAERKVAYEDITQRES